MTLSPSVLAPKAQRNLEEGCPPGKVQRGW